MTDPRELKPCPFCGGAGHVARAGKQMEIICQSCNAAGALSVNREEAIEAWNRRADQTLASVPDEEEGLIADMTNEHFRHEMQHLRSSAEIDQLFQQAASVIRAQAALIAEKDKALEAISDYIRLAAEPEKKILEAEIASLRKQVEELTRERQQSMLDICRERERAEAAESARKEAVRVIRALLSRQPNAEAKAIAFIERDSKNTIWEAS